MEIEDLILPVSETAPCGLDFDEDHILNLEATTLETMIEGEIDPKDGKRLRPKWPQIMKKATELSRKGKNLRVAAILTEVACVMEGMNGLRDGLRLIREWSERYWETLYPLDLRQPMVQSLSREQMLMKPLFGIVYAPKEPGDDFSFDDFMSAWEGPGEEAADSRLARLATSMIGRLSPEKRAETHAAIVEALDHAKAIEAKFDEKFGTDDSIDFSELRGILAKCVKIIESYDTTNGDIYTEGSAVVMNGEPSASGRNGSLSRSNASAMLDQVIRFFESTEPSSPVPFLLRRAQRCIGKNFMELIEELANDRTQADLILKPFPDSQNKSIQE